MVVTRTRNPRAYLVPRVPCSWSAYSCLLLPTHASCFSIMFTLVASTLSSGISILIIYYSLRERNCMQFINFSFQLKQHCTDMDKGEIPQEVRKMADQHSDGHNSNGWYTPPPPKIIIARLTKSLKSQRSIDIFINQGPVSQYFNSLWAFYYSLDHASRNVFDYNKWVTGWPIGEQWNVAGSQRSNVTTS